MKAKILLISMLSAASLTGACFAQNVVTQDSVQVLDKKLESAKKFVIPSGKIVLADMKTYKPVMYSQYKSGKKMQRTGLILTGVGGGVAAIGAIFSVIPNTGPGYAYMSVFGIKVANIKSNGDNSGLRKAGNVMMVAGAACLSVGLPIMINGGKKKKHTFQDFKNQYYLPRKTSSYFQININPNSVGIAFVF